MTQHTMKTQVENGNVLHLMKMFCLPFLKIGAQGFHVYMRKMYIIILDQDIFWRRIILYSDWHFGLLTMATTTTCQVFVCWYILLLCLLNLTIMQNTFFSTKCFTNNCEMDIVLCRYNTIVLIKGCLLWWTSILLVYYVARGLFACNSFNTSIF